MLQVLFSEAVLKILPEEEFVCTFIFILWYHSVKNITMIEFKSRKKYWQVAPKSDHHFSTNQFCNTFAHKICDCEQNSFEFDHLVTGQFS